MKYLLYSLLIVASLSTSFEVSAGEFLTTRRVGDLVRYRAACHTVEDIMTVGRSLSSPELSNLSVEEGKCFILPRPVFAVLKEWVGGPYGVSGSSLASAWKILDQFNDTEFALFKDYGGPHEAQKEAS